MAMIIRRWINF